MDDDSLQSLVARFEPIDRRPFAMLQQLPARTLPSAHGSLPRAIPQPHTPPQPECLRETGLRAVALCLAGLAAGGGVLPPPAAASIPLGPPSSQQSAEAQRAWAANQLGGEAM